MVDDIDLKTSSRTLEKFIILNNLELNYTFIAWMFWRYTPKENNLKTYTSSRPLEKFIILNNIELNYMLMHECSGDIPQRKTICPKSIAWMQFFCHFKNCLWSTYWLASIACILVILNINSLAGPIWMYRLSRSFPMRYKRMLQVSWRGTWPESSLTSPGKIQLRATARSPTTNTAQTWETSCRRTWTGSMHRKTERETTGEWYLFPMIAYKQSIYKILSCNCYRTWSF